MKLKRIEPYKELTEKALKVYNATDPISILTDGEIFKIDGAYDIVCETMDEVNAVLESIADDLAEIAE